MTWWCRLGFHEWGKWETSSSGPLTNYNGERIGTFVTQKKECIWCRKIKLRTEETSS